MMALIAPVSAGDSVHEPVHGLPRPSADANYATLLRALKADASRFVARCTPEACTAACREHGHGCPPPTTGIVSINWWNRCRDPEPGRTIATEGDCAEISQTGGVRGSPNRRACRDRAQTDRWLRKSSGSERTWAPRVFAVVSAAAANAAGGRRRRSPMTAIMPGGCRCRPAGVRGGWAGCRRCSGRTCGTGKPCARGWRDWPPRGCPAATAT